MDIKEVRKKIQNQLKIDSIDPWGTMWKFFLTFWIGRETDAEILDWVREKVKMGAESSIRRGLVHVEVVLATDLYDEKIRSFVFDQISQDPNDNVEFEDIPTARAWLRKKADWSR